MSERKKYQVALLMSIALAIVGFLGKNYAVHIEDAIRNVPSADWRQSVDRHMSEAEPLVRRFIIVEDRATETRDLVKGLIENQARIERKLDAVLQHLPPGMRAKRPDNAPQPATTSAGAGSG